MMDFSSLKKLTIGGVELKQLFIDGIQVWKSGYKNWVRFSTEADGVTIYNGGLGYKNGYRVRSGGAEGATGHGSCTGFIPVKGGDVIRFSGWDMTVKKNENAVNVSDSSYTNIGQAAGQGYYGIILNDYPDYALENSLVEEKPGVYKWVVPPAGSGVAYIRVSGYTLGDGSGMIVTINEEIT